MKMDKYNYGFYSNDKRVMKDWSQTEYFLNNQQLRLSKHTTLSLKPLIKTRNIAIKYILYGLFDLSKSDSTRGFSIKEIYDCVVDNKNKYDLKILLKANKIAERSVEYNYLKRKNSNLGVLGFDKNAKIKERLLYNDTQMSYQAKVSIGVLYKVLDLLLGRLIEMQEVETQDRDYLDDKRVTNKYYYLSSEGKRLMKKVVKEGHLL